jgi:hypothetical protein
VRWWPSLDAYQRAPRVFLDRFGESLAIFADHGVQVMPVLFNRWRAPECDFGGVCLEHIAPATSYQSGMASDLFAWPEPERPPEKIEALHKRYLEAILDAHRDDPRILAWDLCNEPLMAPYAADPGHSLTRAEVQWLRWARHTVKAAGATQPVTIGSCPNMDAIRLVAPLSDFVSFHPYYMFNAPGMTKAIFEGFLDDVLALAKGLGKGLLASETAWGATDDATRAGNMAYELEQLTARGLGFIAQGLQYSRCADLHDPDDGPVDLPGAMYFIHADGRLRAGHDAYNRF